MPYSEINVSTARRLIQKAGADRVSDGAANELAVALDEIGVRIAMIALEFTKHSRRATVEPQDISVAAGKVLNWLRQY